MRERIAQRLRERFGVEIGSATLAQLIEVMFDDLGLDEPLELPPSRH